MVKSNKKSKITGLEITRGVTVPLELSGRYKDQLNKEYIAIKNSSRSGFRMANWQITGHSHDGQYKALYFFPEKLADGKKWWFAPGETIFVFTGKGSDKFVPAGDGYEQQFHFYMNLGNFLWNTKGAAAVLWDNKTQNVCRLDKFYLVVATESNNIFL